MSKKRRPGPWREDDIVSLPHIDPVPGRFHATLHDCAEALKRGEFVSGRLFVTREQAADALKRMPLTADRDEARLKAVIEAYINGTIQEVQACNAYDSLRADNARMEKVLRGVIHHDGAVKPQYKLPESLMREVRAALAQAKGEWNV